MADPTPLRIGILGAARIAPAALVKPAREVEGAEIVAVAARDPNKARRFARKHRLPRVHESYGDLLEDPDIDAVYNPLPNGLHCAWTIAALAAGKHVLCEKPIASNEAEARRMAEAAERAGRVLMEAFHWRYHPLATRILEILAGGELGSIRHVESAVCFPLPIPGDIRWRFELAGGATMDAGCYAVSQVRHFAGAEPEVVSAVARSSSPKVDRYMRAELRFPDGCTGRVTASMFSTTLLKIASKVVGDEGELRILNPILPHAFHRLTVRTGSETRRERVPGEATYTCQLRAFVAAVRDGGLVPTDGWDGVRNMAVIDAIYDRAGLPRRGTEA